MSKTFPVLAVALAFFAGAILHRPAKVAAQNNSPQSLPPQVQRFQIVQLHKTTDTIWSGLLDTQTGCAWIFANVSSSDNYEWAPIAGPVALQQKDGTISNSYFMCSKEMLSTFADKQNGLVSLPAQFPAQSKP